MSRRGIAVPKVCDQATLKRALGQAGYTAQGGTRHVKMVKQGCAPVMLPRHKGDYPRGLVAAIVRQAGLNSRTEGENDE